MIFETGGLGVPIQFYNPNSTGHDDPECDMSRAAAEKKQREVLEYAQKKQRAAEGSPARRLRTGLGHRPGYLTAMICDKITQNSSTVKYSKNLDVYSVDSSKRFSGFSHFLAHGASLKQLVQVLLVLPQERICPFLKRDG